MTIGIGQSVAADGWATDSRTGCAIWHGHPNPPPNIVLTWSGACTNGRDSGDGVFVIEADGEELVRYTGPLESGKPDGVGVFVTATGDRYEGDFRDGKFDGTRVMTTGNGARYEGDFKDGMMHGDGVMTLQDGTELRRKFMNGMPLAE
ncbi:MAG: hypothetical protein GY791_01255 [Alphaproteobacteria bacterium]|nr:hypothetical protein [Alphaproteobacteria bacterium]